MPTKDEWQKLAKHYGGVFGDSNDNGKASYIALMDGGTSQFNTLLGGGSDPNGGYKRIEAHGFTGRLPKRATRLHGSAISAREGQRFIFKTMERKSGLSRSVV